MPSNSKVNCDSTPIVYHREYENDLPKQTEKNTDVFSQCLRVTKVALPFIGLYKPLSQPLSIVLGSTRVISSVAQMISAIQSGDSQTIGKTALETAIATTALVCSIFAHPLGMIVTTSHDMIINVIELTQAIQDKDYKKAAEISLHLINNALYLTCFFAGSLELSIASIGFQIFLGLYNSCDEFKKGNYLEGCGHLLMAGIRGHQMSQQVKTLQFKWKMEGIIKKLQTTTNKTEMSPSKEARGPLELTQDGESQLKNESKTKFMRAKIDSININESAVKENTPNELVDALIKYGNNPDGIPSLLYAAKQGDLHVVKLFIDHGADPFTKCVKGKSALNYALFSKNPSMVEFFLNKGLDPNKETYYGEWFEFTDLESFKLLFKYGLKMHSDFYQNIFETPSLQCLGYGRLDLLQFILLNGGDLPRKGYPGIDDLAVRAIFYGDNKNVEQGRMECLKWLLSTKILDLKTAKYDINLLINTPKCIIEYLIDNDYIAVNQKFPHGGNSEYPLIIYCYQPDVLNFLIKRGADVNSLGYDGRTKLHNLASYSISPSDNTLECIKILLENGADVNIKDRYGKTPLDYASIPIIQKLLIDYGAVKQQKNETLNI